MTVYAPEEEKWWIKDIYILGRVLASVRIGLCIQKDQKLVGSELMQ